jgi:hypothetical protein
MNAALDLRTIDELTHGRLGKFDVACPICSPTRKPANRRKRVLRIWRLDPGFATYSCAHCFEHGYARDGTAAARIDPVRLERVRREAAERERDATAERLGKARRMWRASREATGTPVDFYLRSVRGITVPLPATVRCLPPLKPNHHLAMIVPYGIPDEPEPGVLAIAEAKITAVHLVLLKADGSGKADVEKPKITIGSPAGLPMVLAPLNDLLGLAICEGVEDALSVHQATGLGAWASGGATFMPKLAAAVPDYTEAVTVFAHADEAGQQGARELAAALVARGIVVHLEGGMTP